MWFSRRAHARFYACVLAGWIVSCDGTCPPSIGPDPTVVVISIDTLRPDHLGAYGYERDTSPEIDALAAGGALFTHAVSTSSWTLPAHAALFTGLSDRVHGCNDSDRRLSPDHTTLAETFAAAGYRTLGFFSGPFLHPTFGLDQGFDAYIDCSSYAERSAAHASRSGELDRHDITTASHRDITSPRIVEAVRERLAEDSDQPLFLFIHMWDVHFDFIPPPPFDTRFDPDYTGEIDGENFFYNPAVHPQMDPRDLEHIIALYDGEIAWTDLHVGQILETLEARGALDNAIVVVTSDHGEEFFEHGLKGHRFTLYDEVIRIPLILWAPGRIDAGRTIDFPVSLIDLFATLVDLSGIESDARTMGRSLLPLLEGEAVDEPSALTVSELDTLGRSLTAYRKPAHKLLIDRKNQAALTYDLEHDPGERLPNRVTGVGPLWERDLLRDADARRRAMRAMRQQHESKHTRAELDPEMIEQLEALGYLEPSEGSETRLETPATRHSEGTR